MFCGYCGNEIPDGSGFCGFCGHSIAGNTGSPDENSVKPAGPAGHPGAGTGVEIIRPVPGRVPSGGADPAPQGAGGAYSGVGSENDGYEIYDPFETEVPGSYPNGGDAAGFGGNARPANDGYGVYDQFGAGRTGRPANAT